MTRFLNSPELGPSATGVSAGAATEPLVFAAALAIDLETMKRVAEADTIANETRVCLRRLEGILREAGCTLRDIAKTTCYLSDEAYRSEFIDAYKEVFEPGPYPARCSFVLGLAGDCRVQIEAIAVAHEK